jgi:glutamate decarboxylase
LGSLLIDDMKRALEYFARHPVQSRPTSGEASGFHH